MPGEGTVTIRDRTWAVWVATTPAEWVQGLSNVPSIPEGTGMLFDLGHDQVVQVSTEAMLFPIDIVWIHSTDGVVYAARNIPPGEVHTPYQEARFFLEVNAGEAAEVEEGDQVTIDVVWAAGAEGTDLSGLVGMVVQVGIMGLTLGMVGKLMKGLTAPRERPRLYGPRGELLPQTGSKLSRDERVRFIGACKVSDSLCLTHEQPVSRERRCPRSELTDEEWGMVWDVALEAFPDGQPNPWVNGWWPPTREEAERVAWAYEQRMQEATARYAQRMYAAAEMYRRSVDRAVYQYRRYVLGEYERGKELSAVSPRLIGPIERRELPEELEFFADSREQILASTDPHRQEMDRAFREAIERVRTGVSALKLFRELKG